MSEFQVELSLTVREWQNLNHLSTALYQMLKSGKAQFSPDLLARTQGSEQSQKSFAKDLILLRNVLRRVVEEDGLDLPGESPRDLDRTAAAFSMEEASAVYWCVTLMLRMLTEEHPDCPPPYSTNTSTTESCY
jgi:hypothetical protein